MSGVRVAYVDLSLVRRPSITREEWAANVMAFYQQMDVRLRVLYGLASVDNVSITTKLLIAFASADVEGSNLASVMLPRNELIFEGIKFGLHAV